MNRDMLVTLAVLKKLLLVVAFLIVDNWVRIINHIKPSTKCYVFALDLRFSQINLFK